MPNPLNTLNASEVMMKVLARYEPLLPLGLAATVRTMNTARIFHILPQANYTPHFDAYYRSWFAAINIEACGGTTKVIGIAKAPTDVYTSFACPAFCAPSVNVIDRRIYVNRDAPITIGTLYHEFIHFLSHGNFYPEFYATGGRSPIILEGVTEYLTREINPLVEYDRESQAKYQSQLDDVTIRAGGRNAKTFARFAKLAFLGDLSIIPDLGGAVPRLR
jgi:hypothetical protein